MFWNVWISFFTVVGILEFYNGASLGFDSRYGAFTESMSRHVDSLAERTVAEDLHAVVLRNVSTLISVRLPFATSASITLRLIGLYSILFRLVKPYLGKRLCSGI